MRRLLVVLPALVLFTVAGIGLFRANPGAELGRPAPAFSLLDLETRGRQWQLDDLMGKPAVLNFWASWCEPCRDEAPELAEAAEEYGEEVSFLGINILDGREEALRFVEEFGITYPSARDPGGSVSRLYTVTGVPETFFLDPEGRVVGRYVGAFLPGRLQALLEELLRLDPGEVLDITGRGETRPLP